MNNKLTAEELRNKMFIESRGYALTSINSAIIENSKYQREFDENKVNNIVKNFDERIANEPKLSYRDGVYYVFDGQHTIAARKRMNGNKDLDIVCKIFFGLTEADEALLFAEQTGFSSKPTPGITLRAKLIGNDSASTDFVRITQSLGIQPSFSSVRGNNRLRCVRTAEKLFKRVGKKNYIEAMNIIINAWGGRYDSLLREVITSVCGFVKTYEGQYNRDKLICRLAYIEPYSIVKVCRNSDTNMGKKKAINYILELYNCDNENPLSVYF